MAEFFDKFLNEFSHVIAGIEDTKTKGLMSRLWKPCPKPLMRSRRDKHGKQEI